MGVVPQPVLPDPPIDQEIRRFDDYLRDVRGLIAKTRSHYERM
jgi:hypothetical protein